MALLYWKTDMKLKGNINRCNGDKGVVFVLIFSLLLAVTILAGKLPFAVAAIYLLMSFAAFIAYAMDKSAAQNGRWRTQERTLHLYSLLGGWPGALLAQKIVRHKSNKAKFKTVYWLTVILNISALCFLFSESGVRFINNITLFVAL